MKKKLIMAVLLITTAFSVVACSDKKLRDAAKEKSSSEESSEDVSQEESTKDNDFDDGIEEIPEPTPEPTEEPVEEVQVVDVREYLNSDIKAIVDEGVSLGYYDFDNKFFGKKMTFDELTDALCNDEDARPVTPTIYTYVIENRENPVLLIKYEGMDIDGPGDDSITVVSVANVGGEYHIAGTLSAWSRSRSDLMASGLIVSDGSAGAGDHIFEEMYFANDGSIQHVYFAEECYSGWIGGLFQFYNNGFFSQKTIDAAYALDNDDAVVTLYKIGDKSYGYTENQGGLVDALINASNSDGLEWLDENALKKIIDERKSELGLDGPNKEIPWEKLK
ncbi:MAG: hypothetical protein MJZ11_02770 [Lachnospiraceae bacterium]|nr:hypothetical protein [Lachnospiraceae bacterium]